MCIGFGIAPKANILARPLLSWIGSCVGKKLRHGRGSEVFTRMGLQTLASGEGPFFTFGMRHNFPRAASRYLPPRRFARSAIRWTT